MQKEGAFTAFNLDGGGSTTMVQRVGEKQTVLNTPSVGVERPVADVLGVEVP
jgi:exopolysaccharide biosynthesis protein